MPVGPAPRDLGVLLLQMIETGDGAAAYYTDVMQAVVNLALAAPGGPPANAASFLDRLDVAWLETAYGDGLHGAALSRIRAAKPHVGDIQLRYATLLGRLGPALDGPGTLAGADAWYCILEGTREASVAEAQAMALTELVAHAATTAGGERRAMLLAADDYSAVSRRVPISNLYERGRSLGLGVQVSAPNPGKGSAAMTTSGTGSPPPPTAASGSCTPPTPNRWCNSPGPGRPGVRAQAHRRDLGRGRHHPHPARLDRRPRPDPHPGHRPSLLHPPGRGHVRAGRPAETIPAEPPRGPVTVRYHPAARPTRRRAGPAAGAPGAGEPGRCPRPGSARVNPFTVLGLPTDPGLADEQIRAAWRTIAAATHPDRPDGGDVGRYTAAATAYAQLRAPWGRSEAYADLAAGQPYVPAPASLPVSPGAGMARAARLVPARIRHGRPWHLLARAVTAAVLSLLVIGLLPGQPSGPAIVTGLAIWFLFTARGDLAPPPGR